MAGAAGKPHGRSYARARRRLLGSTALAGCLLLPVMAADAADPVGANARADATALAQADSRWNFAIPAQDLSTALMAFAKQTGIQVVFKSEDLAGLKTDGLFGDMSSRDGLRRLLDPAGIPFRFATDTSVVVSGAAPDESGAGSAMTLAPINVESVRNITSYQPTKGYVSYYSVAATKTDTPVIETPQSISTIGRQEMDTRDVQTIAEAVEYSPSITTNTYGVDPRGYDNISIRGFYTVTTGSFRDGLRMDGNFFAVYTTEPYGIERVDIMRGPSGALYGQAEAGGVIDRTTKRPQDDMIQDVQVSVGNWDTYQGQFDIGGAVTEDKSVLVRLTALGRQADTEFDYNNGQTQDNDRIFVAPAITWKPAKKTDLTFFADYLKDSRSTIFGTFASPAIGRTDVVAGEPDYDRFKQTQYSVGNAFAHEFNDIFTVRQKTRYSYVDVDYQTVAPSGLAADGVTINRYAWASPDTLHQIALDNQAEARFALGPTFHTALAGVDYSRSVDDFAYYNGPASSLNINNPVYTGAVRAAAPYVDGKQTLQQVGAYLQDQATLFDNWILTLGGRYSWVEQITDDQLANTSETKRDTAFTGRGGITYLFDNGIAPYFSYTEGFVPQQGVNRSGESFQPEESTQYEAGVKYQPKAINALITAAVFQMTKTNVLTVDPADINASIQTGEIRTRGFELEAKASILNGLDATLAYSYLDAEVTESNDDDLGKVPVNVPHNIASAWLNYTFPDGVLKGLGLGGGIRYIGSSWHDNANTSKNPSYTLVDAAVSYKVTDGLAVQLNVNNLLDKEYTTTCAFGSCYYGPGRRVIGTVSYRW
jgi:iron complex outermembrane receptor protein